MDASAEQIACLTSPFGQYSRPLLPIGETNTFFSMGRISRNPPLKQSKKNNYPVVAGHALVARAVLVEPSELRTGLVADTLVQVES